MAAMKKSIHSQRGLCLLIKHRLASAKNKTLPWWLVWPPKYSCGQRRGAIEDGNQAREIFAREREKHWNKLLRQNSAIIFYYSTLCLLHGAGTTRYATSVSSTQPVNVLGPTRWVRWDEVGLSGLHRNNNNIISVIWTREWLHCFPPVILFM